MREEMHRIVDVGWLFRVTGMPAHSYNLATQLFWATKHQPDLLEVSESLLPIGSLLYYYLCGAKMAEYTWISVSQLVDGTTRRYSDDIFDALHLPLRLMPEIVEPGTRLGGLHERLASDLGLDGVAVVATATHDTACALLAAPVSNERDSLLISLGTWSLVGQLLPAPVTNESAVRYGFGNEGGVGNVCFLRNGTGTWLLQELRRHWARCDGKQPTWGEMIGAALDVSPFACMIDPDEPSLYCPENMEAAMRCWPRGRGRRPQQAEAESCVG